MATAKTLDPLNFKPDDPIDKLRLIRWKQLAQIVPYSKSRIKQLEDEGSFPKRVVLGPGAVAWRYAAVAEWVKAREEGAAPCGTFGRANLKDSAVKGNKRPTPSRRKAKGGRE